MKIVSKQIQVLSPKNVTVTSLNDSHPFSDDCVLKRLTVNVNAKKAGPIEPATCLLTVDFAGKEYEAFYAKYGDGWTSANLNEAICEKLGLKVDTTPTPEALPIAT